MFDVEGFILVGGASSRMGSDKAQLKFDGQTGVELIAAALRPIAGAVRLVGSREEACLSPLQNIPDLHERWGRSVDFTPPSLLVDQLGRRSWLAIFRS